ncbi:VWA domain-containing protein [Granulicella sp. WH15]|uniref:VWA domain-containing protein n=1 Tax=Granulicella sp. WH15 TaxID=2602070 RepID=UPI00136769CD|nr:VWA domain-containing protein [Granulicella sp. WH15]QHN05138.1 VWA domain-containing protein [Granulicella sp. WH15]
MRAAALLPLILATASLAQTAPPPEQETPFTLRTSSNIVFVPAQVQTKQGEMIYTLKPEQFVLTDNGVPQKIHVDEDVDSLGLSLVVAVQCSRAAFDQFNNIRGLAAMIDDITGGAPRQVAVVSYGGEPTLLGDFTSDPARLIHNLNQLQPCDESDAAHLDAVAYSNSLLNDLAAKQNGRYRQAILLISETRDHGSHARPADVIAGLGRSNTVLDAVSYNPGRTDILESLFHGRMGPGPIGLLVSAVQAVRKNVPHTLASLSGGEYVNFSGQHGFDDGLHSLANHIHNYYLLSFQTPSTNPAGLHRLALTIPDYPDARLHYRLSYYSGEDPPPTLPGDDKDDKDSKDKKDDKHKF